MSGETEESTQSSSSGRPSPVLMPPASPRSGAASAPIYSDRVISYHMSPGVGRPIVSNNFLLSGHFSTSSGVPTLPRRLPASSFARRRRAQSLNAASSPDAAASFTTRNHKQLVVEDALSKARSRDAQRVNDSMIYLEGAQIYTCAQCRTHLTSHDDIISKSFHGRHGRAYLFDQCVNVTIGPAEDRVLITGLHSVCDIFCKRCKNLIGWTYKKAYEASQKYKEGKYIIEKINLHFETGDYYDVEVPAGERMDRFRLRSMSWGCDSNLSIVYEYSPSSPALLEL